MSLNTLNIPLNLNIKNYFYKINSTQIILFHITAHHVIILFCPKHVFMTINWRKKRKTSRRFMRYYIYDFMWMCRSILAFLIYEMWCVFAVKSSHFCYIPNRNLLVVGKATLKAVTWNSWVFFAFIYSVSIWTFFSVIRLTIFWYSTYMN